MRFKKNIPDRSLHRFKNIFPACIGALGLGLHAILEYHHRKNVAQYHQELSKLNEKLLEMIESFPKKEYKV